ncbi:MAPEG family protein [bacterium]|nr:MAPEG family protein [bacterium]
MATSICALLGFAALTLLLPFIVVNARALEIVTGKNPANAWGRDKNTPRPPFILRLEHAHANCIENLVVFAAIVLAAAALGKSAAIDAAALFVLYARVGQIVTHAISTNQVAVLIRATFYFVQLVLMAWMLYSLMAG